MPIRTVLCVLGLAVSLMIGAAPVAGRTAVVPEADQIALDEVEATPARSGWDRSHVPGEILVGFEDGADRAARARLGSRIGAIRARQVTAHVVAFTLSRRRPIRAATIRALEQDPAVLYAEPNGIARATATPDDANFSEQWGLRNTKQFGGTSGADIDASGGWNFATGAPSVVVAVVDTGIDLQHPDLENRLWTNGGEVPANGLDDDGNGYVDDVGGWDWVDGDNDPDDEEGHGTHVAGIIGAEGNDAFGITGVAWDVQLMPLRVLDADGSGTFSDIAAAFDYAGRMGARVVNASLGGGGSEPKTIRAAIAAHPNTLYVVAAGNDGVDVDAGSPSWPCSIDLDNVLCVAASRTDDGRAGFSNYGDLSVDLAAPGVDILSTSRLEPAGASGSYALTDSTAGNYLNDSVSWAKRTSPIDLTDRTGCYVVWDLMLESEYNPDSPANDPTNDDWFRVQASGDGITWTNVRSVTGWTNGYKSFTPTSSSYPAGSLASFQDGPVYIRFAFESNGSITFDGAYVDNVDVTCTGPDPEMPVETFETGDLIGWTTGGTDGSWGVSDVAGQHEYMSGTSMATPFAAGVAALVWGQKPGGVSAGVWAVHVRNVIRGGLDGTRSWMRDMLAWGGRLDLARSLQYTGDLTAPTRARITGSDMGDDFQPRRRFGVRWAAEDPGAGLRSHDVRYKRAVLDATGFAGWQRWTSDTDADGRSFVGSPGSTYCFDTRARDNAFNVSRWGRNSCTAVPVNDRALDHSDGWRLRKADAAYLGTYSRATRKGATLVLRGARFRTLALVATTCADCGKVRIFRGSRRIGTIDLSEPGFGRRRIIPVASFGSVKGPVKLRIKVISAGKPVIIEGLGVSRV